METISKIDNTEAFEALAAEWNGLLSRNDTDNVFLTHEWVRSWWQAFGSEHDLYLLTIRDGGTLVGLAPLMRSRAGLAGRKRRVIQFIGTPNADYADIIGPEKEQLVELVCVYLAAHRDEWDRVELSQIGQASATTEAFRKVLERNHTPHEIREIETCMGYVYDGPEEKRATFQLPRKTTLKRSIKHLNEAGGLTLEQVDDRDAILSLLPEFFHAHIVRWEDTVTPSKFNKPAFRAFYENLVTNLGPAGHISFKILRFKECPIAWFFTYRYNNTAYLYTLVHNRFYSKYSPGNILITMIVDDCVRQGYVMIDHTRGAKAHKGIFANREAVNYRVTIFKSASAHLRRRLYDWLKGTLPARKLVVNQTWNRAKTKAYTYYSDYGLKSLLMSAAKKIIAFFFSYETAYLFEKQREPSIAFAPGPEITFQQLGPDDIATIAGFLGFESGSRKHQAIMERFGNGGECFLIRYNGTPASMSWGLFRRDYMLGFERYYTIKDNEVLFGDGYTSPIFRGRRLHPLGIMYKVNHYQPRQLRVLTICLRHNINSIKGICRTGFVKIGVIRSLRILGIRII